MRYLKYAVPVALLGMVMLFAGTPANAQVRVGVGIGVGPGYVAGPPACTYGYYGYAPYACAPYGYYGPDYFNGGVFIGAGPWFHGWGGGRGGYGGWGRGGWGRGFGPGWNGRGFVRPGGFRGGAGFRGGV